MGRQGFQEQTMMAQTVVSAALTFSLGSFKLVTCGYTVRWQEISSVYQNFANENNLY
jgi:hypothetical protein